MEKLFKLKEHGTNVRTEILAGMTTFLAMAYILVVNPNILQGSGMEWGAIFTATAISAAIGCFMMGFGANYPIALASGLGLNAYFVTVCGQIGGEDPWKIALTAILVEGIIFIILSFFKFRETLVNKIPKNLKFGISAGIGMFIAIIGLKGAGVVVGTLDKSAFSDLTAPLEKLPGSLPLSNLALGDLTAPPVVLCLVGLLLIGIMAHKKIPGAILWGIVATWILGMIAEKIGWYQVNPENGAFSLFPDFSKGLNIAAPNMFKFNFSWVVNNITQFIVIVFAFLFVDLFDTVGTVIGVAEKGNLLDKDGSLPKAGAALMADAVATVAGACMGTSTVTSYVESSAGVAQGGRTGLTAISAGCMFLIALIFSPIFTAIPTFATAPALIYVGLLMVSAVKNMTFEGDTADAMSGYIAIIMMAFTCSIANGIMFGILFWVLLKVFTGKIKEIHPIMWIAFALFALRIATIVLGIAN
ncbi:MAG: NCS2 family permease [Oscillospiraceae bacterium]|nr:NCS2 family permease [Oscillospiraceae bacterium]